MSRRARPLPPPDDLPGGLGDEAHQHIDDTLRDGLLLEPGRLLRERHLAAMMAARRWGRAHVGWARPRTAVAGGGLLVGVFFGGGLAAAGELPSPLQGAVASVAQHLGMQLPATPTAAGPLPTTTAAPLLAPAPTVALVPPPSVEAPEVTEGTSSARRSPTSAADEVPVDPSLAPRPTEPTTVPSTTVAPSTTAPATGEAPASMTPPAAPPNPPSTAPPSTTPATTVPPTTTSTTPPSSAPRTTVPDPTTPTTPSTPQTTVPTTPPTEVPPASSAPGTTAPPGDGTTGGVDDPTTTVPPTTTTTTPVPTTVPAEAPAQGPPTLTIPPPRGSVEPDGTAPLTGAGHVTPASEDVVAPPAVADEADEATPGG